MAQIPGFQYSFLVVVWVLLNPDQILLQWWILLPV